MFLICEGKGRKYHWDNLFLLTDSVELLEGETDSELGASWLIKAGCTKETMLSLGKLQFSCVNAEPSSSGDCEPSVLVEEKYHHRSATAREISESR